MLHPTYDKGALITYVDPDSPANKEAGLGAGDIIISLDDKEISTGQELIQAIHSCQVGQRVKIIFWRDDTEKTTYATLIENLPL